MIRMRMHQLEQNFTTFTILQYLPHCREIRLHPAPPGGEPHTAVDLTYNKSP